MARISTAIVHSWRFLLALSLLAILSLPGVVAPQTASAAPLGPTGLTGALVNGNRIDLSWVDNSTGEMGFRIEAATNATFTSDHITFNAASDASFARAVVSLETPLDTRQLAGGRKAAPFRTWRGALDAPQQAGG